MVDLSNLILYFSMTRLMAGETSFRSKSASSVMGPLSARCKTSTSRALFFIGVSLLLGRALRPPGHQGDALLHPIDRVSAKRVGADLLTVLRGDWGAAHDDEEAVLESQPVTQLDAILHVGHRGGHQGGKAQDVGTHLLGSVEGYT